jgi:hypothetical protein
MRKLYLLISIILFTSFLKAQDNNGPRITALGNAGVALQDVWSVKNNQAGIAGLKKPTLAAGYENRFGINELSTQAAVFAIPIKDYALGLSFNSYGVIDYRENKTGISLAKSFGSKVYLAIGLNYHQLKINNYGNAKAISVDVGLQYQAFPKLWLASHISNPNQSKYGVNTDQIIPTHIQFGANYIFSEQLLIITQIEKILDAQVDFKAGIEYKIIKFVALRGGISVNPFKQFAGFGINYQRVNIDFAVASHPVLGYSPQVALGYEF